MWEIQHSIADWDYSKTQTLLGTLKTQNPPQVEFYVSSEVEHSFPQVGCVRNTSVSHSSTDSEVLSVDAGLRMDGIPALDVWDLVIEVLHSSLNHPSIQGNLCDNEQTRKRTNTRTKKHPNQDDLNVDHDTTNANISHFVCFTILKTTKQESRLFLKRQKSDDETRVPYPQSCA